VRKFGQILGLNTVEGCLRPHPQAAAFLKTDKEPEKNIGSNFILGQKQTFLFL